MTAYFNHRAVFSRTGSLGAHRAFPLGREHDWRRVREIGADAHRRRVTQRRRQVVCALAGLTLWIAMLVALAAWLGWMIVGGWW